MTRGLTESGACDGGPRRGGIRDWQLDHLLLPAQESTWRMNGELKPILQGWLAER